MDNLGKFRTAILQGARPKSSIPELSRAMESAFALPGSEAGARAIAGGSAAIAAEQEAAAEAARRAREAEIQDQIRKEQDKVDPSKYYSLRNDQGGYDFFDPEGKKINVHDYAMITGQRVDQILADSENPLDIQFVEDYGTMRKIMNAYANRDVEALNQLKQADPELYQNIQNAGSPAELSRRFMDYYPDYFGRRGGEPAKLQDRFTPRMPAAVEVEGQGPVDFGGLTQPTFGRAGVYSPPNIVAETRRELEDEERRRDPYNIFRSILSGVRSGASNFLRNNLGF